MPVGTLRSALSEHLRIGLMKSSEKKVESSLIYKGDDVAGLTGALDVLPIWL